MKYFLSLWHHSNSSDPVWMAYEVDEKGGILRRIERFPDGSSAVDIVSGSCNSLSDIPFDLAWIDNDDPEFSFFDLSRVDFENLLKRV